MERAAATQVKGKGRVIGGGCTLDGGGGEGRGFVLFLNFLLQKRFLLFKKCERNLEVL